MTPRARAGLAAGAGLAAFAAAFFARMNAAYGPFNLSLDASDWSVLWELWASGQIAATTVAQAAVVGLVAALAAWIVVRRVTRPRRA